MLKVLSLKVNPFAENTYLVYNELGDCIVFDPGMSNREEQKRFQAIVSTYNLKPVRLINTHCHIDHVLGIDFMVQEYGILPEYHRGEDVVMASNPQVSAMYHLKYTHVPQVEKYIETGEKINIGDDQLLSLFTPGHSPASLSFYSAKDGFVMAGDVLFQMSIGRYDLPGGDEKTLLESIRKELFTLPDETIVYPGHGPSTTIGFERTNNPFFHS